jgi:hypothetical protein
VQALTEAGALETSNGNASDWPGDLTLSTSRALKDAADKLTGASSSPSIHWLPKFGCALLPVQAAADEPELRLGEVAVHLIQLDNWSFRLHRYTMQQIQEH